MVQKTDSPETIAQKYIRFSKLGINPHTGEALPKKDRWKFQYAGHSNTLFDALGIVGGAYGGQKAASSEFYTEPKQPTPLTGTKNSKKYTLDRGKSQGNYKFKIPVPKIPIKSIENFPQNVIDAYKNYDSSGWSGNVAGQKAGGSFKNRDGKLPSVGSNGEKITYKEFDINNKLANSKRDAERFVKGSDDKLYYTNDHYQSFVRIE